MDLWWTAPRREQNKVNLHTTIKSKFVKLKRTYLHRGACFVFFQDEEHKENHSYPNIHRIFYVSLKVQNYNEQTLSYRWWPYYYVMIILLKSIAIILCYFLKQGWSSKQLVVKSCSWPFVIFWMSSYILKLFFTGWLGKFLSSIKIL